MRKALDADFGRMLKEDRMVKLMAKSDRAVVQGKKTVAESLEEVRLLCTKVACAGGDVSGEEQTVVVCLGW